MTVVNQEIRVYRGERKSWVGVVKDAAGAFVNLTDASIYFVVRDKIPSGSITDDTDAGVIILKTVGAGITLTDPTNGEFELAVNNGDTNSIELNGSGKGYMYGISLVENGQTEPIELAMGRLKLLADIVRSV